MLNELKRSQYEEGSCTHSLSKMEKKKKDMLKAQYKELLATCKFKFKIQLSNCVLIFAIYIIQKYLMSLKEYSSREKEPKLCRKMYKRHPHC